MKKVFLSAALAIAVAGSWAFYPKSPPADGYMMVVSSISGGFNAQAFITVVSPDGTRQETEVDFRKGSGKKLASNTTDVHVAALAAINTLARQGWHVVSTAPGGLVGGGSTITSQVVYVLEKN